VAEAQGNEVDIRRDAKTGDVVLSFREAFLRRLLMRLERARFHAIVVFDLAPKKRRPFFFVMGLHAADAYWNLAFGTQRRRILRAFDARL
jgi:hypothetical protein